VAEAFSLCGFSYRYPQAREWALRDVDLALGPGLHLLAGASGSGKSTLLRTVNGLVPHFHGGDVCGRAIVAGRDVLASTTRALAGHAGIVFQDPETQSVYATVERDVAFGLENLGVSRGQMIARVGEALERMGIAMLRSRAVATLSGGERQRLALAGVLAMRPAVIALDEPLSQLDPVGAAELEALLRQLAAAGATVLMAEHRLNRLLASASSLTAVDAGRVTGPYDAEATRHLRRRPAGARVAPRGAALSPPPLERGELAWALRGVAVGPGREPLVEGVDVAGASGEVTVLIGRNGSGKTTLLRTVAGLLAPRRGRVERAPGRVAYLPQNPTALLHRSTLLAEVELTLRRSGERDEPERMLRALSLAHLARRYPRDLSAGERQRAALAAVLAGRPRIALLDEPTRGMDDGARRALVLLLRDLTSRGTSVLMATHDGELAAEVADRLLEVGGGRVRDLSPAAALASL
jgi:energy-coupling factor transport system ATP-binding protein